mmetsp:Transcript_37957/g.72967  ORF Transcript_37957/g.72967 Transcript_37957/m.72967 type:complete len:310 (-) Transcript_37957:272-1201(-)
MKSVWWLCLAASKCILGDCQNPFLHMLSSTTVVHDGYEYRTLMPGVVADSIVPKCHQPGLWLALPGEGWMIAPDTPEVRRNVVATHSWSSHVVVLDSMKGITTLMLRTIVPGTEFGDRQPKARMRYMHGVKEWTCPWTCYQILIRRALKNGEEIAEPLLPVHRGKTIGDFLRQNPAIVDKFGKKALQLLGKLGRPAHENDYKHQLPEGTSEEDDEPVEDGMDIPELRAEEASKGLPPLPWLIAIGATCVALATVCLSCGVCLGARWFSSRPAMPAQPLLQASGRDLVPISSAAAATADTGLTSYQEMEI